MNVRRFNINLDEILGILILKAFQAVFPVFRQVVGKLRAFPFSRRLR